MRFFHKTTEAEKQQIKEWHLIGMSSVEIGRRLKKDHTTILFWLGKLKNKKPITRNIHKCYKDYLKQYSCGKVDKSA